MKTLQRKSYSISEIKEYDDETGTIKALVNTLGVVDADGDRIIAGAFNKSLGELENQTARRLRTSKRSNWSK